MGYSRTYKAKICRYNLRNIWSFRPLSVKQANRLLTLQKKSKESGQKLSYFANQLNEKRKFSSMFQGISTKYLAKIFNGTKKTKLTQRTDGLILILERRLDVALVRLCFCRSISEARQLILHSKILVNNLPIKTCSYLLKNGDIISINNIFNKSLYNQIINNINLVYVEKQRYFSHLEVNYKTLEAIFLYSPQNINYTANIDSDLISNYINKRDLF